MQCNFFSKNYFGQPSTLSGGYGILVSVQAFCWRKMRLFDFFEDKQRHFPPVEGMLSMGPTPSSFA